MNTPTPTDNECVQLAVDAHGRNGSYRHLKIGRRLLRRQDVVGERHLLPAVDLARESGLELVGDDIEALDMWIAVVVLFDAS